MMDKIRRLVFIIALVCILLYFMIQETGAGIALCSFGWLGCISGRILGTLAGGAIAVYLYLLVRRVALKLHLPKGIELWGFILYTMIVITAVRQIPR